MDTYSIALAFNNVGRATIVCHNENGIDIDQINDQLDMAMAQNQTLMYAPKEYTKVLCKAINQNCDCKAIIVYADLFINLSSSGFPQEEKGK